MNTKTLSFGKLCNSTAEVDKPKHILHGLLKGHVGMLIAVPSIGKSHLALSIAIENASSTSLIGLTANPLPSKTLIVSTEDGESILTERLKEKARSLNKKTLEQLDQYLDFTFETTPFVIQPGSSHERVLEHEHYLIQLEMLFKNYELVIIDTVTEAIGDCDEVTHDRIIKNTFSRLAKSSGASILLVHHVNKNEIHGHQKITMASGAGLTSIMRLTKCLLSLSSENGKLTLNYQKGNYLQKQHRKKINLKWDCDIIVDDARDTEQEPRESESTSPKNSTDIKPRKQKIKPSKEPKSIVIKGTTTEEEDDRDMRAVL
ncbi:AAA family ATPase [Vibrio sp. 1180_3]|uniref:AAA family ATPase n=1 Tax=Vibrio sp. 1180_3 TaxID=2528832 RepID=UPI0024057893|nr:AAA family ATPase [Vibrio sp. 1180_3]MDF9399086.1 replication protein [Vibrio sp. 1180_3]